jgi:beta-glucosidase
VLDGELRAEYFNAPDLSGAVVHRAAVPEAQLMWLDAVGTRRRHAGLSRAFSGTLQVSEGGWYTFDLTSAGRSRLFIDDALIVDNWDGWRPGDTYFGSGSAPQLGEVQLAAGYHGLRLEFGSHATGELGISAWRVGMFRPLPETLLSAPPRSLPRRT